MQSSVILLLQIFLFKTLLIKSMYCKKRKLWKWGIVHTLKCLLNTYSCTDWQYGWWLYSPMEMFVYVVLCFKTWSVTSIAIPHYWLLRDECFQGICSFKNSWWFCNFFTSLQSQLSEVDWALTHSISKSSLQHLGFQITGVFLSISP